MNTLHISNYEYVARKFAEETIVNEKKEKYFLEGVAWAFRAINSTIESSGHPMAENAMNEKMMDWTVRDIKKAMKTLMAKSEAASAERLEQVK